MTTGELCGLIGGIAGGLIGLTGGIIGTYFSIKNTGGPLERSFMIKAAFVCWTAGLIFLALLFLLPNPYRWFLWIPYGILLPLGVIYGNRKQQDIRTREARNRQGNESRFDPEIKE